MWQVAEASEVPKNPSGPGEDRLVIVDRGGAVALAAVVDGATDKSGRDYGGTRGGALAADTVAGVLRTLTPDTTPSDAVARIATALVALRRRHGVADDDPLGPSAVAAVFMASRGEIWRVGDVHVALRSGEGWRTFPADKEIDRVVAHARAAYLRCLLADGIPASALAVTDPGRSMVLPVLQVQNRLANRADRYGYGLLDGTGVPPEFLQVFPVDATVREIVLASDGYLSPVPSLSEAEDALASSLAEDPLRVGDHPATKGVLPGEASFDDRTYLRLTRT
ncbi:hypothetical protein ACIQUL_34135 [Streptomyces sp. NPDC090303]|uniref:hypothetical protein n=1 Tax=Streptomyces sp. NPDC090303 TaxID=3365960 RepID=UPI003830DC50